MTQVQTSGSDKSELDTSLPSNTDCLIAEMYTRGRAALTIIVHLIIIIVPWVRRTAATFPQLATEDGPKIYQESSPRATQDASQIA